MANITSAHAVNQSYLGQPHIRSARVEDLGPPLQLFIHHGRVPELLDEGLFPLEVRVAHPENLFGLEQVPNGRQTEMSVNACIVAREKERTIYAQDERCRRSRDLEP